MKRVLLSVLMVSCLEVSAAPNRSIFTSRAQGQQNAPLVEIKVWPGHGVNLNFIPAGEVIRKIWLDDPTQVVLDTDSCLDKEECRSQILHLRQIKPVSIPGLSQAKSKTTLLTVITTTTTGNERKLYQFRVVPTKGKPEYQSLSLVPDSQGTPWIELPNLQRASLEDLERGLSQAQGERLVEPALGLKVRNFVALVRNGETIAGAAQQAGISMSLVNTLAAKGVAP